MLTTAMMTENEHIIKRNSVQHCEVSPVLEDPDSHEGSEVERLKLELAKERQLRQVLERKVKDLEQKVAALSGSAR